MKTVKVLLLFLVVTLIYGCGRDNKQIETEKTVEIEGVFVELAEKNTDKGSPKTRAIGDFAVNKDGEDPTREVTRLTGAGNWTLDVTAYDINGYIYPDGVQTFSYAAGYWIPQSPLFLPHYRYVRVDALLYPPTWTPGTSVPALDQGDETKLLEQDILEQNGDSYTMTPAHIPTIQLRHQHSMLDFILVDVDETDIADVKVVVGTDVYTPCKLTLTSGIQEYMVILPVGISNPEVTVTTNAGARYTQTVDIAGTATNHCYCVELLGLELLLSSVTVINWTYGEALEGQYTTIASYPTFRGQPNATITLYYDNGNSQEITFNERGESTVRPRGRTIIQINNLVLTPPVILDEMYVDLTDIPGLWG